MLSVTINSHDDDHPPMEPHLSAQSSLQAASHWRYDTGGEACAFRVGDDDFA